jgi:ATP-binding cassette subfamily B protein
VRLEPGERVAAACRFDLDSRLRFTDGWIVLTDRRFIADQPASADGTPESAAAPRSWPLDADTRLDVHLRAAVGRIELSQDGRIIARWLFTPARAKGVHALEDVFDARQSRGLPKETRRAEQRAEPPAADEPRPAVSARGIDGAEFAPGGTASWRALARVLSFAKPHAGMAVLGGLLSLASTTAALVPPYLTMPLVDQVLIPRQNGADVPFTRVWWYLGGLRPGRSPGSANGSPRASAPVPTPTSSRCRSTSSRASGPATSSPGSGATPTRSTSSCR